MRLRRCALSFLLLTGLSLGVLSPARAADGPTDPDTPVAQVVDEPTDAPSDPATDPVDDAPGDNLTVESTRAEARESLAEVGDLFDPMSHVESQSLIASGEGRDATLALRDLSLRLGSLSRAQRASAYEDFQRPVWASTSAAEEYCPASGNICLHWKTGGSGPKTDSNWARNVVYPTLMSVSRTYKAAGYRQPRGDGGLGGSGQTDIYLDEIGNQGKYGYCTVDVDSTGHYVFSPSSSRASDLPAFCVLDNDYSKTEFPTGHTSKQDLQVTAAHEYFHAVQFAYDYLEDRWFMEASATWAEDQVYDSINDNAQYLRASQLLHPSTSLDQFGGVGGFLHYGDWIYLEYLTERLPARRGALPALMLRTWQLADSVAGPDLYSVQAIAAALREKGKDFNGTFAAYVAANRHPQSAYAEGRANRYPSARPRKTVRLTPGKRSASATYKVDHLASATTSFVPKHLKAKRTRLTLSVDMADRRTGSVAVALVYLKSGRITTKLVKLGRSGGGRIRVPFSSRKVARVELALVNANHSYRHCWNQTPYSCSGVPVRENVKEKVSARVS